MRVFACVVTKPMPSLNPQDVVAFLQNPWFKESTKQETIDKYRTDADFRRRLLAMSPTGERLCTAFGDDWFRGIHWDNANTKHGSHYSAQYQADIEHMAGVIAAKTPLMVVTFGAISTRGWQRLVNIPGAGNYYKSLAHMSFRHPMAYGVSLDMLMEFAARIQFATT